MALENIARADLEMITTACIGLHYGIYIILISFCALLLVISVLLFAIAYYKRCSK